MLEDMIEELNDTELQFCYIDIVNWKRTGMPQLDGQLLNLWRSYKLKSSQKDFTIHPDLD
ncbi:hypothetical protein B9T62_35925 [Paenibacillus donghaensis]|uniref:Uncharacterized protein n=1 Tax=Paenibacillus donghaensis TaxID=414771 RepID=A0A2Z2KW63_9BACL|nr:hypothetical protein B9T62_35925 [Paenibacillus donghaensis]